MCWDRRHVQDMNIYVDKQRYQHVWNTVRRLYPLKKKHMSMANITEDRCHAFESLKIVL